MASVNRVMLAGRLGADPELRYTASGQAVSNFNLATNEVQKDKDGNRKNVPTWHRIVVWGKQAENCKKYLAKGRSVFVEGRIVNRQYEDKDGATRYSHEITAGSVQFLDAQVKEAAATEAVDESDVADNV